MGDLPVIFTATHEDGHLVDVHQVREGAARTAEELMLQAVSDLVDLGAELSVNGAELVAEFRRLAPFTGDLSIDMDTLIGQLSGSLGVVLEWDDSYTIWSYTIWSHASGDNPW